MQELKNKLIGLVSKRLGVSLIGILTIILNKKLHLGIDDVSIASMSAAIMAYVVSLSAVEHKQIDKGAK